MSNENYVVLKILKGLSEHLHCSIGTHRKTIHGKKKHDFNFKSTVKFSSPSSFSEGPHPAILIWRWSQDQGRYYQQHSMQIICLGAVFIVRRSANKQDKYKVREDDRFEISNPNCFDYITEQLIQHLDWRG